MPILSDFLPLFQKTYKWFPEMLAKWHEIVTMFYGLLITVWVLMPSTYRNHNLLMAGSKHFEVKWRLTRPNLSRSLFNKSHLLQNSIFFLPTVLFWLFSGLPIMCPFLLKMATLQVIVSLLNWKEEEGWQNDAVVAFYAKGTAVFLEILFDAQRSAFFDKYLHKVQKSRA